MGRPVESFHGFCGQGRVISMLKQQCAGALAKGKPVPHLCLSGPSGMGKTELATALAKEMKTNLQLFYCSKQSTRAQMAKHFAGIKSMDIVFLDEVHALEDPTQELLYPAIDRHQVPKVHPDNGRIINQAWLDIPEFTLVVATDQPGELKNALMQRLVLRHTMVPYTEAEMRVIVGNMASEWKILLSPQAITRIARAACGNPRRAKHVLTSLYVCLPDLSSVQVSLPMIEKHLHSLGIDADNLDENARRYLGVLNQREAKVSLETLSHQLGLDKKTISRDVEPCLIQRNWLDIGLGGRSLTHAGAIHAQKIVVPHE